MKAHFVLRDGASVDVPDIKSEAMDGIDEFMRKPTGSIRIAGPVTVSIVSREFVQAVHFTEVDV